MLRLLAVLLVIGHASSAWALSCVWPGPVWWPSTATTLPSDAFIVLHMPDSDDYDLEAAWFEAESERIEAVIEILDYETVFRPKTPLTPGVTYTLTSPDAERLDHWLWQMEDEDKVPVRWTVDDGIRAPARWLSEVHVGESIVEATIWGRVSQQTLRLDFEADGPVLAEVQLTRDAEQYTLLRPVESGTPLTFGRGPCVDDVDLIGRGEWTAAITLIGPDGARSSTKTVRFSLPMVSGSGGCAQHPAEGGWIFGLLLGWGVMRRRRETAGTTRSPSASSLR